jgi:hypothetical protein
MSKIIQTKKKKKTNLDCVNDVVDHLLAKVVFAVSVSATMSMSAIPVTVLCQGRLQVVVNRKPRTIQGTTKNKRKGKKKTAEIKREKLKKIGKSSTSMHA